MPIPLKLTVYKGSDLIGEHRFEREIVKIGRLASAHLKLEDAKVSRIHAVIEATSNGGEYSIIDMGSTEGTFVNGERVSKEKLSDGDEIRLGDCRLLVSLEDSEVRLPGKDGAGSAAATRSVSAAALPAAAKPTQPAELWPATAQEIETAQPTMSLEMAVDSGDIPPATSAEAPRMSSFVGPAVAVPSGPTPAAQPSPSPVVQLQAQPGGGVAVVPNTPRPRAASIPPAPPPPTQVALAANGGGRHVPAAMQDLAAQSAWGSVPNNLASEGVPEAERALEIKLIWRGTVIDTFSTTDQRVVTLGDERKTTGFGPFQKLVRCDIEAPSKGLPAMTYALATSQSTTGCSYAINIPASFQGRLEKADGNVIPLDELLRRGKAPADATYNLNAAETLFLEFGELTLQIRYVRHAKLVPPPFWSDLNYTWVNMLILAFFIHTMAIVSFIATPVTQAELTEDIFKNPNRFAQFRLTAEEKKKQNDFLKKLKDSAGGAKAKGEDGKAGKKDHPKDKKQGRMAVKAVDPNDKEVAKSTLAKLFGAKGNTGRSYLFGSGGLGGELKGALGGVTGAEVGDASGLGGLGTRGSGPGGGGLSMNSVGLGALGTAGRGGGGNGYGDGVGGLGKKTDREIDISQGAPVIQGSLDKELIRRVIREHMPQIRYCYEKELSRSPGLFGKVATEFTISASGSVEAASIAQSTMNNAEVERCIASKIRTWVFPKPKGGGVVLVKYPFIFKTSG